MTSNKLIIGLAALSLSVSIAQADNLELGLVIDGSGSIDATEFATQKNGYIAALTNPAIIPADGTVTVGIWQFSGTASGGALYITDVLAPLTISSAADRATMVAAVTAMTQHSGAGTGWTAIGDAIIYAADELVAFGGVPDRRVIDVSTDGNQTAGANDPDDASLFVMANRGVNAVNGLFVGDGIDSSWIQPPGFKVTIDSFDQFEPAIAGKIRREVQGAPDGGATVLLMLGSLVGLLGARRLSIAK